MVSKIINLALLFSAFSNFSVGAEDKLTDNLLSKISDAQKVLLSTEKKVANERQLLARKLTSLESEVVALRAETAAVRRLADEKTLSLSQLENRLKTWTQQQNYQQGLLHRFLQQQNDVAINKLSISEKLDKVLAMNQQFEQYFLPSWQPSKMILPSGDISTLETLSMGPISWYLNGSTGQAGLASLHDQNKEMLQSDLEFDSGVSSTIATLYDQANGYIVFDPTMNRAMARQQNSESLFEHLLKGGKWAIPIVFFAIFALTIASFKVMQLTRLSKVVRFTPSALNTALSDNQNTSATITSKVKGMQRNLLHIALTSPSIAHRDDQLFMQLQDDKHRLDRWIGAIGMTAAVSPLLGLLGTVSGMIETFKMMTLFGSGDPEVVSGGIAQALVTTELGLVVAIPALILNALLSRKAKSYYNELESFAILISKSDQQFKTVESVSQNTSHKSGPAVKQTDSKGSISSAVTNVESPSEFA